MKAESIVYLPEARQTGEATGIGLNVERLEVAQVQMALKRN
jgi:hypothetical protein